MPCADYVNVMPTNDVNTILNTTHIYRICKSNNKL